MFNEHLRRIRIASGRTQGELAAHLNISTQSISKWEKGQSVPSVDVLPQIAEFFSCTINAFFSDYELEIFESLFKNAPSKEDVTNFLLSLVPELELKYPTAENEIDCEKSIPTEALFVPKVYKIIQEHEVISCSLLQHNLGIGFAMSVRIIEALDNMGIVKQNPETLRYEVNKSKINLLESYL